MTVIRLIEFGLRTLSFPGTTRLGSLWSQRNSPGRQLRSTRPFGRLATVGSGGLSLYPRACPKVIHRCFDVLSTPERRNDWRRFGAVEHPGMDTPHLSGDLISAHPVGGQGGRD